MRARAATRFAAILAVLFALIAGAVAAQPTDKTTLDYNAWEQVATAAEKKIGDPQTETPALIKLREELSSWRAKLLDAENVNNDRISTLKGQINALGPAPEEGQSEPGSIAERRATLTKQLADADAPRLQALEAYNRANGLISEIDDTVRTRQTEALLETVPMPTNPANWPSAVSALTGVAQSVAKEIVSATDTEDERQALLRRSPVTLALLFAAGLLLARGRIWMTHVTDWFQRRGKSHGRLAMGFVLSITQVFVPIAGITLLIAAVAVSGLGGPVGLQLLGGLLPVAIVLYGALWLAGRVFTSDPSMPTLFELDVDLRRALRRTAIGIGVVMALAVTVRAIAELDTVSPADAAVLKLPVIALLCYGYWRMGHLLRRAVREAAGEETPGFALWMIGLLARLLSLVAIVTPLLAAVGYMALSDAVATPTGVTLWIIGLFVTLQWPIRDLYATFTRSEIEEAGDALIPVLVNVVLMVAALPLLALIWGVRPEQMGELYTRFSEGFTLGGTRLTPGVVLTVLLVFAIGYTLTRFFQAALKSAVLPRTRLDVGARNAVVSFVGYLGIGLAALLAVTSGGIDLTALGYIFGALSVGIGFGLQNVVQNFVAGIILLIERPIGEGDWIEVGDQMGIVKSISVRSTTIETFDKQQVIVPNADFISNSVTNWTRGSAIGRAIVEVGVAYGTDTRKVEKILMEIAHEHPVVAHFPEPGVDFMGFGASSLDFRIRMILRDINRIMEVTTEVRHRIAERFAEEGIEIPFAQQDIWLRNPETLRTVQESAADVPAEPTRRAPQEGPEGAGDDGDGPEA